MKNLECIHTTGCYFHGQALAPNALIPSHFCAMFWLRKSNCSESFESERFTTSVAQVVNHGEKFDSFAFASKWEWVSVNNSGIGLVGDVKLVGHFRLRLFVSALLRKMDKSLERDEARTQSVGEKVGERERQ